VSGVQTLSAGLRAEFSAPLRNSEFGDYMTKRALALHILVKQWHIIKNFAIETEKKPQLHIVLSQRVLD